VRKLYVTSEELADRWRTSPRAIRGRITRGHLPAIRFEGSRRWLIAVETVEALERSQGGGR
jgi:hypothetical protein